MTPLSFSLPKKGIFIVSLLLSLLLAAYTPMAAISSAQSAVDASKLQQLKTKAVAAIDRQLANLKATLQNMNVTAQVSDGTLNATAGDSTLTLGKDGFDVHVVFPTGLKDKAKDFAQKISAELTAARQKITSSSSLTEVQALATNVDTQSQLGKVTNVQGAVTQAVQSLTSVFHNLQMTAKNMQSRVQQIASCAKETVKDADCAEFSAADDGTAAAAQSKLDNIKTIMTTIATVISSAIVLLTTLSSAFAGILGSVGKIIGDIANMGTIQNADTLKQVGEVFTGLSGLLTSFSGLMSQLDIASGMSSNSQSLLGDLSTSVNN